MNNCKSIVSIRKRLGLLPFLTLAASCVLSLNTQAQSITGAGATFPAPLYAKWAEAYRTNTGKLVNYQPIGSGGGIKQILAKTVDFGASDDPMKPADIEKNGLLQFPTSIGAVVLVVNLPDLKAGQLVVDGKTAGDLFRGALKTWNDPQIAALNPGVVLPNLPVTPVYRSDSSGTTAVFTDYLAQVNASFKSAIGQGKSVDWPAGIGGKGNAGVAANVGKIRGSVGYVEYAFAKQGKLKHVAMLNRNGKQVQPNNASFVEAAQGAKWGSVPGFGISINNQARDGAWPITAATFVLVQRNGDVAKTAEVLKFFAWAMRDAKQLTENLSYVALPDELMALVETSWAQLKDASGKPLGYR